MVVFILGIIIIILTFADFFHTTLSSNGFGKMSHFLNQRFSWFLLKFDAGKMRNFSGLVHLLFTFLIWVVLLYIGSFLIFISNEDMVLNSITKIPATNIERFYYTSYVLTTLGIGDFVPGRDLSRIFTSLLAFSGFVMLTTGMSYLISVLSGVNSRKNLASTIFGMGENLDELYDYAQVRDGKSNLLKNSTTLKQMIINYTSQHRSLPIIHYFFTIHKPFAVVVQLARLYEVLNIVHNDFEEDTLERKEIKSLQNAINYLLSISLFEISHYDFDEEELRKYRITWSKYDYHNQHPHIKDEEMDAFLKSSGWSWKDVYSLNEN